MYFTITSQAQNENNYLILDGNDIDKIHFHIYNPSLLAKPIYKNLNEVSNSTPELLMSSIMSETSQEWVNYNTWGGSVNAEKTKEEIFSFRKTMNPDSNYFELVSKLSFQANGLDMALVKFYLHSDQLPMAFSGVKVMQAFEGRWYATSTPFTTDLAIMFMRFQSPKLIKVLKGEKTGDTMIDELIKKVKRNGSIDLNLLIIEFQQWYQLDDKEKLNYFIDPKAW